MLKQTKKTKNHEKKTKDRLKPLSLHPLSLEKALEGALKVVWPPKEEKV
jgi:hypothetical protein